ncbi:MAG: isochorismatase family protein [bacterium]|nr:isochorismatase family protein [bacterium]
MEISTQNTILLVIDIQEKLLNAVFNKDYLERKAGIMAKVSSILELPVILTEQYPKGLGKTVESLEFHNASVYEKNDFNALLVTDLFSKIEKNNPQNILVIGIETHICVYQTVRALLNKGYNVTVMKDACGSRSEYEHSSGLDAMRDLGAKLSTVEMTIFELLKTSRHPNFKEIQALIK